CETNEGNAGGSSKTSGNPPQALVFPGFRRGRKALSDSFLAQTSEKHLSSRESRRECTSLLSRSQNHKLVIVTITTRNLVQRAMLVNKVSQFSGYWAVARSCEQANTRDAAGWLLIRRGGSPLFCVSRNWNLPVVG